jgi:glycosyltransferase involved in cell wall biosynthesis
MMTASVVVAAYNEAKHIERCLTSLALQSALPLEVIVVDDGSRDSTAALAHRCGAKVIRTQHRGPAHARNVGAEAARGDFLVFVDADMACAPGFLAAMVAPIEAGHGIGTFSKEIYLGNPESRWACAYCRIRRLGNPRLLPADFPDEWANYRALRRDEFLRVGGYDDVGYGEDMTLAPKLGRLAIAASGARCLHFNPDSPREIFANAHWIGRGYDIGEVAHPWRDNGPWRTARRCLQDLRSGAGSTIIPARLMYSLGILLGLAQRVHDPESHWM